MLKVDEAWQASVALKYKCVVLFVVTFQRSALLCTVASLGLPSSREMVIGIPSGSDTSIGSSSLSPYTA